MSGKFIWPLFKFWKYSPQGWVLAAVWNCYELLGKPMPSAGKAFGVIIGKSGKPRGP